jgi:hypothetical protein
MTALLGWLLFAVAPGHVALCEHFEFTDGNALVCEDSGIAYPEGNYALHHDRDDGEMMSVEVWR